LEEDIDAFQESEEASKAMAGVPNDDDAFSSRRQSTVGIGFNFAFGRSLNRQSERLWLFLIIEVFRITGSFIIIY
jgi:hypothetical protein